MSGRDIDMTDATAVIQRIADIAEAFAEQAGVGGTETAGLIISYLAEHPRDVEPCLRFGTFELPHGWPEFGRLTWLGANGKIVRPEVARRARVIKNLERSVDQ